MAKEPRSLQGKVVAITGGARGIGKATAKALAREGAVIAIGDLDADLARATASELGEKAVGLELDVIINNAGIMPIGPFAEEDDATAKRMIDINLHGVIYGTKLAIPPMVQ